MSGLINLATKMGKEGRKEERKEGREEEREEGNEFSVFLVKTYIYI